VYKLHSLCDLGVSFLDWWLSG